MTGAYLSLSLVSAWVKSYKLQILKAIYCLLGCEQSYYLSLAFRVSETVLVLTVSGLDRFQITLCKAIHVQQNDTYPMIIQQICVCVLFTSSDWLKVDFWVHGPVEQIHVHRTVKGCCLLTFRCVMYRIQISTSTHQNLFNARANSRNDHWT